MILFEASFIVVADFVIHSIFLQVFDVDILLDSLNQNVELPLVK